MNAPRRRLFALATAVAFATSFGLPFVSPLHAWVNDPDAGWDIPLVSSSAGHGGACFGVAGGPQAPEHCAICHWMRALGNSLVGVQPARPELPVTPAKRRDVVAVLISAPAESRPARGPPPSLA